MKICQQLGIARQRGAGRPPENQALQATRPGRPLQVFRRDTSQPARGDVEGQGRRVAGRRAIWSIRLVPPQAHLLPRPVDDVPVRRSNRNRHPYRAVRAPTSKISMPEEHARVMPRTLCYAPSVNAKLRGLPLLEVLTDADTDAAVATDQRACDFVLRIIASAPSQHEGDGNKAEGGRIAAGTHSWIFVHQQRPGVSDGSWGFVRATSGGGWLNARPTRDATKPHWRARTRHRPIVRHSERHPAVRRPFPQTWQHADDP